MKVWILPVMILGAFTVVSCSLTASKTVKEERVEKELREIQQVGELRRTREQGKVAASGYQQETGFTIYRYDLPLVRTGFWPHSQISEHFGIKEWAPSFGTLDFYQGWNTEMDRLLLRRYGSEYLKYRRRVLPQKGVQPTPGFKLLIQPDEGFLQVNDQASH